MAKSNSVLLGGQVSVPRVNVRQAVQSKQLTTMWLQMSLKKAGRGL